MIMVFIGPGLDFSASAALAREVAQPPPIRLAQARRTCKSVSSCREAVILWCSGYSRADADDDGIPCENVCPTKTLVDRIRAEIGC
jgi:hypothetical protein